MYKHILDHRPRHRFFWVNQDTAQHTPGFGWMHSMVRYMQAGMYQSRDQHRYLNHQDSAAHMSWLKYQQRGLLNS